MKLIPDWRQAWRFLSVQLAAVIALLLRAPFIVVVIIGAAVAAGLRALGWN